ncbi:MAG: helix-turn-helix domain-containing protein [Planctomycetota bacterium]
MHGSSPTSRRLRAAELFARGWAQADVARALGVTRTTAMRWHQAWRRDGPQGLVRSRRRGRPRKLTSRELTAVLDTLPRTWPIDRVARELEARTGVHYHPGHVWRILKRWGWSQRWDPTPAVQLRDPDGNLLSLGAKP